MQIRKVCVSTSLLYAATSCKSPIATGWKPTKLRRLTVCNCTCILPLMQTVSTWNYLRSTQKTLPGSGERPFMNTCASWKSTAIWSGSVAITMTFAPRLALRKSVRIPTITRTTLRLSQIRRVNPLIAVSSQRKQSVRRTIRHVRPAISPVQRGI